MNDASFTHEEDLPDHHFRTELPNCIFDMGLSPYHIAYYAFIKRIAGDKGKCWQSIKNIATTLGISERKIREIIVDLEQGNNKYKLKLIQKIQRKKSNGSYDTSIIQIINIWPFNGKLYKKKTVTQGGTAPGGVLHNVQEGGTAPGATEEEPSFVKEEPPPPSPPSIPLCKNSQSDGGGGFSYRKSKDKEQLFISKATLLKELPEFSSGLIDSAIKEAQDSGSFVSNPTKYLKKICERLITQAAEREKKKAKTEEPKVEEPESLKVLKFLKSNVDPKAAEEAGVCLEDISIVFKKGNLKGRRAFYHEEGFVEVCKKLFNKSLKSYAGI